MWHILTTFLCERKCGWGVQGMEPKRWGYQARVCVSNTSDGVISAKQLYWVGICHTDIEVAFRMLGLKIES